jgi:hypothetical protein
MVDLTEFRQDLGDPRIVQFNCSKLALQPIETVVEAFKEYCPHSMVAWCDQPALVGKNGGASIAGELMNPNPFKTIGNLPKATQDRIIEYIRPALDKILHHPMHDVDVTKIAVDTAKDVRWLEETINTHRGEAIAELFKSVYRQLEGSILVCDRTISQAGLDAEISEMFKHGNFWRQIEDAPKHCLATFEEACDQTVWHWKKSHMVESSLAVIEKSKPAAAEAEVQKVVQAAEGWTAKFGKMHWAGKTAVIGATAATVAGLGYWALKEKERTPATNTQQLPPR